MVFLSRNCYFFVDNFFTWIKIFIFADQKIIEMSGLYMIPLSVLKDGRHIYDFVIGNDFFKKFEESEVREGKLEVLVDLDKRSSHFDLVVKIRGKVKICCDRCLKKFFHSIVYENRFLVKYGEIWDIDDPDIITIPADENELDLNQYIYESIHLALPIQRFHPYDKYGKSTCDPVMLKKLEEHLVYLEKENDPRWDGLKRLISNN